MRSSTEFSFLGSALGFYLVFRFLSYFYPVLKLAGTLVIGPAILALFFPFINIKNRFFLCTLHFLTLVRVYYSAFKLFESMEVPFFSFLNKLGDFLDPENGVYPGDMRFVITAFIASILYNYFQPFFIARTYKKLGLYEKMPFKSQWSSPKTVTNDRAR